MILSPLSLGGRRFQIVAPLDNRVHTTPFSCRGEYHQQSYIDIPVRFAELAPSSNMAAPEVPKKQKAAVYDQPGTVSTKVVEIDVPEPGAGEVLINLSV